MTKLFGSYNSRFFACLTPREVRLYRGISAGAGLMDANEASLVYTRALEEDNDLELIRVANQGDLFFVSKKGLFRLRNDRSPQFDIVNPTINTLAAGEEGARLGKITVDAEGREVCYEVITPEGGLKDRFFKLLGGKSGGDALAHQIVHYNMGTQRGLNFPPAIVEPRREFGFCWASSPGGRFLVFARPEKKVYHLELVDVAEEAIIADFQMALASISDLWVNDAGVVMVDVRTIGEEKLIIALPDNKTRYSFCPPPTYRVINLGPLHVSLILESQRRMQIFDYSGNLAADVDFRPLRLLGVEFHYNFNVRGDIDILGWQNGTLRLQHTDIKAIPTDAKRWDLTARQHQAETEQQLVEEATAQHHEERRRLEEARLSRQLADAVQPNPPSSPGLAPQRSLPRPTGEVRPVLPAPGSSPPASRSNPLPAPTGGTLPSPASPRTIEPPAASRLPGDVPAWMSDKPDSSPPPPPEPPKAAPVAPATEPDLELPPPPPPSAAPLAFLQGGVPLPPPDTESETIEVPIPPMVPPPFAPPAPVEVPEPASVRAVGLPDPEPETEPTAPASSSSGMSLVDLELELERLRMSYIAGEIGREAYYARRAELEGLRRQQQSAMPASQRGGPNRLDLDLNAGPVAEEPPEPTRPVRSIPALELPLPGEDD